MATSVRFAFPAAEIALADTFERLPEVRVSLEQSVASADDAPHCLWITGPEKRTLRQALEDDASVRAFELLADEDDRWLFAIDFWPTVQLLRSILLCQGGAIRNFVGRDGQWVITCRYTAHESLGAVSDMLDDRSFEYDVRSVHNDSETASEGSTLTEAQSAALECACQNGYFEVPRQATLEELADDLGISHQALSERIRRGMATCLQSQFPMTDSDGHREREPPTV